MAEVVEKKRRSFGGKLRNFESNDERNREKKHLKAYLKGKRYYFHGFFTNSIGQRERVMYKVKEVWS